MSQDIAVSAFRVDDIRKHTEEDRELQELTKVILSGWSEGKRDVSESSVPYFNIRDELTVQNGVIFRGESLRKDTLRHIHASHLDIDGCLRRARECLYRPRMGSEIKDYIQQCEVCRSTDSKQQKEPLQLYEIPSRPWAKVAVDLFRCNGQQYLIIVDYFSGFWEVEPLRYGIPDVVISDNGPQFAAQEFQRF